MTDYKQSEDRLLEEVIAEYKYGFTTDIESDTIEKEHLKK